MEEDCLVRWGDLNWDKGKDRVTTWFKLMEENLDAVALISE